MSMPLACAEKELATAGPGLSEESGGDGQARFSGAVLGHVRGNVGPAVDVDHDADFLSAWDGGGFVSVENIVALSERVVMLYASFSDPDALLQPGTRRTFSLEERTLDAPSVVLLGCTGREVNRYDEFDDAANVVDLVVDDADGGPDGALDVTVSGVFGEDIATSTFRLLR
jgi:hypothetical protein